MTILKSTVTWTLVGTFLLGGLNAIVQLVPNGAAAIITGIISVLGIYLHNNQIKGGAFK